MCACDPPVIVHVCQVRGHQIISHWRTSSDMDGQTHQLIPINKRSGFLIWATLDHPNVIALLLMKLKSYSWWNWIVLVLNGYFFAFLNLLNCPVKWVENLWISLKFAKAINQNVFVIFIMSSALFLLEEWVIIKMNIKAGSDLQYLTKMRRTVFHDW